MSIHDIKLPTIPEFISRIDEGASCLDFWHEKDRDMLFQQMVIYIMFASNGTYAVALPSQITKRVVFTAYEEALAYVETCLLLGVIPEDLQR